MTERFVTFVDDAGNDVRYQRYAARLPAFLETYSPKNGYRVEIERTDLLSQQKGRLSLLREAIIAGKKPSDVGLPGIERDVSILVCTAKLLDPQNQVVRSASAAMHVIGHKDFETLETAANQRLLAVLGFGGEMFDEDEDADLRAQGYQLRSDSPDPPGASAPSASSGPVHSSSEESAAGAHSSASAAEDATVTEAERRQVENLARRVGQPVPALRTRADVKAARSQLGALDRQRRSAPARTAEA